MHLIWIHEWISACRWWTNAARQRFRGAWFIYERAATSGSWVWGEDFNWPTSTYVRDAWEGILGMGKVWRYSGWKVFTNFIFSSFKLVLAFSRESTDVIWLFYKHADNISYQIALNLSSYRHHFQHYLISKFLSIVILHEHTKKWHLNPRVKDTAPTSWKS